MEKNTKIKNKLSKEKINLIINTISYLIIIIFPITEPHKYLILIKNEIFLLLKSKHILCDIMFRYIFISKSSHFEQKYR